MKIKHKVQRKLDPTFQAELKLCSLCGPTPWWQQRDCAGSGDWPWLWLSGAHMPCGWTCGVRGVVGVSTSGLQWAVLCCSLRLRADGWDAGGDTGSSGSGAEHSVPQSAGPPQKITQAPESLLILSEPCFHSAHIWAPFGFVFLSQTVGPRLRIWETTEKPIPIQTHEGLFTCSILCSSIPNTAEQGLGPWGGF